MHAPNHTNDKFNHQPRRFDLQKNPSVWRGSKTSGLSTDSVGLATAPSNSDLQRGATISLHEFLLKDRERILRSNLELEHFATLAAHDLKSPLHAAFSWLNILSKQLPQKNIAAVDQSIEVIQRNLQNAISYVNELLQISKITHQAANLDVCIVSHIVSDVIQVHSYSLKDANASIHLETLPNVTANQKQLECVFSNLIGNAIKYKHPSRNLTITIGAVTRNSIVEYFIKDNGVGIPSAKLEDIFTLFETVATGSKDRSTGIGLAFCRKVIDLNGGKIWAESSDGQGTTIRFQLPKTPSNS